MIHNLNFPRTAIKKLQIDFLRGVRGYEKIRLGALNLISAKSGLGIALVDVPESKFKYNGEYMNYFEP